ELHRRALRRDVDRRIALRDEPGLRCDHGEAALALRERFVRRLREIHQGLHVDREEPVELLRRRLVDELRQRHPGVAYGRVEPTTRWASPRGRAPASSA